MRSGAVYEVMADWLNSQTNSIAVYSLIWSPAANLFSMVEITFTQNEDLGSQIVRSQDTVSFLYEHSWVIRSIFRIFYTRLQLSLVCLFLLCFCTVNFIRVCVLEVSVFIIYEARIFLNPISTT